MIKLLLVEDNEDHANLAMFALEKHEVRQRIFWVKDGKEALDFIYNRNNYADKEKHPLPDYILLDIKMPKIDGFEVLKTLKGDSLYRQIPVIMLTTSNNEKDVANSYKLGANSFVTKSTLGDDFMKKVKSLEFYWTTINTFPQKHSI